MTRKVKKPAPTHKYCKGCGKTKSANQFYKRSDTNGLRTLCKSCTSSDRKKRWRTTERHAFSERVQEKQEYINSYLKEHPCVDCGETDPVVLQFDHVHGEKEAKVSAIVWRGTPLGGLIKEIAKCEVRCANCHIRRHARERACNKCKDRIRDSALAPVA